MNSYDHCNSYTNSGVSRFPVGEIWTAVLSATIDRLGVVQQFKNMIARRLSEANSGSKT